VAAGSVASAYTAMAGDSPRTSRALKSDGNTSANWTSPRAIRRSASLSEPTSMM
jgi:hypothetical protein